MSQISILSASVLGTNGLRQKKRTVAVNTTLLQDDYILFVDATLGGITISPPASPVDEQTFFIKAVSSVANTIDLSAFSIGNINTTNGVREIIYDLGTWRAIGIFN